MKARAILLAAFCLALCAADGPVRTWTDSTGKYTVEAELLDVDNGKVRLKKNDGSVVTVPLVKMSAGDRAFLQQRMQERKDEAGEIFQRALRGEAVVQGQEPAHRLLGHGEDPGGRGPRERRGRLQQRAPLVPHQPEPLAEVRFLRVAVVR